MGDMSIPFKFASLHDGQEGQFGAANFCVTLPQDKGFVAASTPLPQGNEMKKQVLPYPPELNDKQLREEWRFHSHYALSSFRNQINKCLLYLHTTQSMCTL